MKFCKDCEHYRAFSLDANYSKCAATISPIDGAPGQFCSISREHGPCGKDAVLYQEKKPVRWFGWFKKDVTS